MIDNCSICDSELELDNGDIIGNFGISPIGFCVWCLSSLTDMVIQLNSFNDIETLKERIVELEADLMHE